MRESLIADRRSDVQTVARLLLLALTAISSPNLLFAFDTVIVSGAVRDDASNKLVACRIYIRAADGTWHFPISDDTHSVVRYERENYWNHAQVEKHATIAAKPFRIELPTGKYSVFVE